jgi:hypothetical protein
MLWIICLSSNGKSLHLIKVNIFIFNFLCLHSNWRLGLGSWLLLWIFGFGSWGLLFVNNGVLSGRIYLIWSYNLVWDNLTLISFNLGLVGILRGLISTCNSLSVCINWLRLLLGIIVLDVLIVLRVKEWLSWVCLFEYCLVSDELLFCLKLSHLRFVIVNVAGNPFLIFFSESRHVVLNPVLFERVILWLLLLLSINLSIRLRSLVWGLYLSILSGKLLIRIITLYCGKQSILDINLLLSWEAHFLGVLTTFTLLDLLVALTAKRGHRRHKSFEHLLNYRISRIISLGFCEIKVESIRLFLLRFHDLLQTLILVIRD